VKLQKKTWILLIIFLCIILLPFALEPIQADDLTSFLTINQINNDKGLFEGLRYWLWLQRTMTGHFVPFGWTLQWFDISIITWAQQSTNINFRYLYFAHNLLILLIGIWLSIFLVNYSIARLERSTKQDLNKNIVATGLIVGILLVNHSSWSIDPFSQHLVYGLGTTVLIFLAILLHTRFLESKKNQFCNFIFYFISSIFAAFTYDISYPILIAWIIFACMYMNTRNRIDEEGNIKLKTFFCLLAIIILFLVSQLSKGGSDYSGTNITINQTTIKATVYGVFSLFPPVGIGRAVVTYNMFPQLTFLSIFSLCLVITIFFFLIRNIAQIQPTLNKPQKNHFLIAGIIVLITSATFTQVANQKWGPVLSHLGTIYLYAFSCTILISVIIYRVILEFLNKKSSNFKSYGATALAAVCVLVLTINTLTNWWVLNMDGRIPNTLIVQAAIKANNDDNFGCIAINKFKEIGYPVDYQELVIKTADSIHFSKFNSSICNGLSRK